MRRGWVVLALAGSGCSLLFDPDRLPWPRDLTAPVPPTDLAVAPDDLTQPPPPDLFVADLAQCPQTTFTGFGDAGAMSLDCPCGCVLDPFTAPISAARWSVFAPGTPGWGLSPVSGTLQMNKAVSVNGDHQYIYSDQHFYLEGDFDLRVDYQSASWPIGGRAQLTALGPPFDLGGSPSPNQNTIASLAESGPRDVVSLDGDGHDVAATGVSGTLQLTRTGARICGGVIGRQTFCKDGSTTGRVRIFVLAGVFAATCAPSCGTTDVRFTNLRLVSGRVVSRP